MVDRSTGEIVSLGFAHSPEMGELAKALAEAQGEFEVAKQSGAAPGYGGGKERKYATLTDIITACRPALVKRGLALLQPTNPAPGGCEIITLLVHGASGQWIRGTLFVPFQAVGGSRDGGDRSASAQALGSALSYGRRYGLSSLIEVATEDDDGVAAGGAAQKRPEQRAPARSGPPPATGAETEAPGQPGSSPTSAAGKPDTAPRAGGQPRPAPVKHDDDPQTVHDFLAWAHRTHKLQPHQAAMKLGYESDKELLATQESVARLRSRLDSLMIAEAEKAQR